MNLEKFCLINFIVSPILYLAILLFIANKFNFTNIIPIVLVLHIVIFCVGALIIECKKEESSQ